MFRSVVYNSFVPPCLIVDWLLSYLRTETDIVNDMERRIWQSIEDGHFENLSGKGKPLNLNSNPHADPT
ncbi:DnaJ-like protein [Tanacetum coccineum]